MARPLTVVVGVVAVLAVVAVVAAVVAWPRASADAGSPSPVAGSTDSPAVSPSSVAAAAPAGPSGLTTTTAEAGPHVAWPAVGALFDSADVGPDGPTGDHFCSGAVVDTPTGDTVVTAAHCVAEGDGSAPDTNLVFVPGYHDGVAPFGSWNVSDAAVDQRWIDGADPDLDIAFLTVSRDGAGPIQDVTGAYELTVDPGDGGPVQVVGYPEDADAPVAPSGLATRFGPTQLRLADADLPGGTSGGPWLRDGTEIIGVTGGYQQGGESEDISYASYLDADTVALLRSITGA
ncbi:MAG: hypothetical protein ABS81_14645 [Pseudonocardia sp. SCN 72-86]|nr:MAG: hypothetical protein ABS81_14645 [Pseudonocardia sp. SCN 72-86]